MKSVILALALAFSITAAAETIGIRNNNPGNIRPKSGNWQNGFPGAVGVGENNYLVFKRSIDGLRAIVINLKIYWRKYHIDTPAGIVTRWTNGDATNKVKWTYAKVIRKYTGGDVLDKLNMNDPCTLRQLTMAIVYMENGKDPYGKLYATVFPGCEPDHQ